MPEDNRDRLIDAVERLAVERPLSQISMRMIAAEAGVSVGLAYYHFDSKGDLVGEALDRMGAQIATRATDPDLSSDLGQILAGLEANPAFAKVVASLVLSHKDVSSIMSGHPLIDKIAARATEAGAPDPGSVAGVAVLLGLTGELFIPAVNRAIGRPRDDERLREALIDMYETWLSDFDGS